MSIKKSFNGIMDQGSECLYIHIYKDKKNQKLGAPAWSKPLGAYAVDHAGAHLLLTGQNLQMIQILGPIFL